MPLPTMGRHYAPSLCRRQGEGLGGVPCIWLPRKRNRNTRKPKQRDNVPFLLSQTEYVVIARPDLAARNKPGLCPVNLVAAQDGFFGLSPYHA